MEQELKGIREQSAKYPAVQNLMHNVNEETLMAEHRKQARKKAVGIDGVDKAAYDEKAQENIAALVERMKKFQYKPLPVRRIPKAKGKLRPLGIPAYEDRLVQGVMAAVMSEVYEPRFLECAYGFRPGRSAHDVVRSINQTIMTKKVNYVLEADIMRSLASILPATIMVKMASSPIIPSKEKNLMLSSLGKKVKNEGDSGTSMPESFSFKCFTRFL